MKSKAIYYLLLGGMLFGFGSCMRDDLDADAGRSARAKAAYRSP